MALCKKALEASGGDVEKAIEYLRVAGELRAQDIVNRVAAQGGVFSYIHPGNRIGALVHVACETDFVARGEAFQAFAKDVAMHIAASKPRFVTADEANGSTWAQDERHIIWTQMQADKKMANKPREMQDKIANGKLEKCIREVTLLDQKFVKDPEKTIEDLRVELVQKTGENIVITWFARSEVGCEPTASTKSSGQKESGVTPPQKEFEV